MAQYPIVSRVGGSASVLNITASTVVKSSPGTVFRVSVTTPGTTAGTVNDTNVAANAAAANLIATIPAADGVIYLAFPCFTGITIIPGAGQVLSVSYA